jgi:hypothetical protein
VSASVGAAGAADVDAGVIGGERDPRRVAVGDVGADEVVACGEPQVASGLRGVPDSRWPRGDRGDGGTGICGGGTTSSERSGRHGS